ncbi:MAG: hypothetical protein P8010_17465 [Desulfosarcinaceae bacterium]|jgi:hypothetical protein
MHIIVILEILTQIFFINHAVKTEKPPYWVALLLVPWVGFLIYLVFEYRPDSQNPLQPTDHTAKSPSSTGTGGHRLAYITQGKLFQIGGDASVEQILSPFGQKIIDQTLRIHQKSGWKQESSGSYFGGGVLWGVDKVDTDAIRVNITSVTQSPENHTLSYVLESDSAGGLFSYNPRTREETRLFHKEKFKAKDLDIHPETKEFVCSQQFPNGTANILLIGKDGTDLRELTEGDVIDEAPSWMPGKHRRILFQSSGIARNKDGHTLGRGPVSIQALDLDNNRMTTVLEDDRYDFLQPHLGEDGWLYYIRRPYETTPYRPVTALVDFVLFPFRLLRAVFHYLNFFSLVYSQKPLTTASGPKMHQDDLKTVMLKGRIIDAQKAQRSGAKIMGVPSLVPASWELVRCDENNRAEILATHAASFDIGRDGTIIYSNGFGIFRLDGSKRPCLLSKDRLIEEVIVG